MNISEPALSNDLVDLVPPESIPPIGLDHLKAFFEADLLAQLAHMLSQWAKYTIHADKPIYVLVLVVRIHPNQVGGGVWKLVLSICPTCFCTKVGVVSKTKRTLLKSLRVTLPSF